MILGADGKRLSKRHGAVSVMQYRDEGYLPEALLNYLMRLGWSHGDQEIFSREEMIELFDLHNINRAPAAFNPEKLLWLNQHYIKTLDPHYVAEQLAWHMHHLGIDTSQGPALSALVTAQSERCKTLVEIAEKSRYFYQDFEHYDDKAATKNLNGDTLPVLKLLLENFATVNDWHKATLHDVIKQVADTLTESALGKVAQPLRVAVTGNTISPPIDVTLELLGKEKVMSRLDKAVGYILLET
jgi:glutamyl-tRNA synthetase